MKNKGQSLIELLIVISLTAIFLPSLLSGLTSSREGKAQQLQREDAYDLLRESEEASKIVRERDWSEISSNGNFYPQITGTTYALVAITLTPTPANGFTRIVNIADAYRDSSGNITTSGTIDPATKKITTTVSWTSPYSSSINSVIYLSRYLNNTYHTETTESDFNLGAASAGTSGVSVINEDGGEVVLGTGSGGSSWCNPSLSISAVDLPKSGVANAISAIEGQVVAGTGENASGVSFARVNISNPAQPTPPDGTLNGTFDGYKTNGVFIEFNSPNYAYVATDNNSKEDVIIDLTSQDANGKFSSPGYFNAPGNVNSKSLYVSGDIGYALVNDKLYTIDLSSKTGSRPQLGVFSLAGNGNKVIVNGSYAYVAVESVSKQLQIIQVSSDGITMSEAGYATLDGSYGRDLFVNTGATRAYVATAVSSTQHEMFVVDISSKTGSRPTVGAYETNGMDPKGIAIVPGNRGIIAGTSGQEYQVFKTNVETVNPTMSQCGGLNIDSGINGLSTVSESDGDNFSYIITGDATSELKIIKGGPGGIFSTSGTFESGIFDAGSNVSFNRFSFTADTPLNTSLPLQVASATTSTNCDSATYSYVGPDSTSATYFTSSGTIPFAVSGSFINPGRCFRYKAFFSSNDILYTAVLKDVTVNYSP